MWNVKIHPKADKMLSKMPRRIVQLFEQLVREMRLKGPVAGDWPNYGKLDRNRHHCHLKKGRPTYVSVWWVVKAESKAIEVTYVGTHEKAPY